MILTLNWKKVRQGCSTSREQKHSNKVKQKCSTSRKQKECQLI